jgi:hypothetical protein
MGKKVPGSGPVNLMIDVSAVQNQEKTWQVVLAFVRKVPCRMI